MQHNATLNPTPDQTFEIEGTGPYNFVKVLARAAELQRSGKVEEACNERFQAFQRIAGLLPEDEEINLEWEHANTRAALEVVYASAVDHFLIGDFEMSAALIELLLELDPEDHLEGVELLGFDYLELEDYDSFDEIVNDISDKYASREIMQLWYAFRREGTLPEGEVIRLRSRFRPYYDEFTAAEHPADEKYLRDIESEHPTPAAQARELWLRTENLWTLHPDFIGALLRTRPLHDKDGAAGSPEAAPGALKNDSAHKKRSKVL